MNAYKHIRDIPLKSNRTHKEASRIERDNDKGKT